MAVRFQGGKAISTSNGIISEDERILLATAMRQATSAVDNAGFAAGRAKQSGSTKRPALYARAIAALNSAKELLDQARSSNGR